MEAVQTLHGHNWLQMELQGFKDDKFQSNSNSWLRAPWLWLQSQTAEQLELFLAQLTECPLYTLLNHGT